MVVRYAPRYGYACAASVQLGSTAWSYVYNANHIEEVGAQRIWDLRAPLTLLNIIHHPHKTAYQGR